jgi:hypothetical protein
MLALSYRQTNGLWRRYRLERAIGLQHRSAGRESHRAKRRAFCEQVLGPLREKYSGGLGRRPLGLRWPRAAPVRVPAFRLAPQKPRRQAALQHPYHNHLPIYIKGTFLSR